MTPQADVVVPVFRDLALTERALRAALEHGGAALRRLIVVNDASPEPGMAELLARLERDEPRVVVLTNERNLGFVEACNRGLTLRGGHAVLLNSDTQARAGWLAELLAVLEGDPLAAAVCPLSNDGTLCSVPNYVTGAPADALPAALPLEDLPRATELPTGVGFCLLMRGEALELLGLLDPRYGRGYHEENDWCQRARAAGLRVLRANRAVVLHHGGVSFGQERQALEARNVRRLVARYPSYLDECAAFDRSPEARVAARAVRTVTGGLEVGVLGPPGAALPLASDEALTVRAVEPETVGGCDVLLVRAPVTQRQALVALLDSPAALVVDVHGCQGSDQALLGLLLECADVVVVPSEAARALWAPRLPVAPVVVRPPLPPWGRVERVAPPEGRPVVALTCGSPELEALVRAAVELAREAGAPLAPEVCWIAVERQAELECAEALDGAAALVSVTPKDLSGEAVMLASVRGVPVVSGPFGAARELVPGGASSIASIEHLAARLHGPRPQPPHRAAPTGADLRAVVLACAAAPGSTVRARARWAAVLGSIAVPQPTQPGR